MSPLVGFLGVSRGSMGFLEEDYSWVANPREILELTWIHGRFGGGGPNGTHSNLHHSSARFYCSVRQPRSLRVTVGRWFISGARNHLQANTSLGFRFDIQA